MLFIFIITSALPVPRSMPFTAAPSYAFWLFANAVSKHLISLICRTFAADFFMVSVSSARSRVVKRRRVYPAREAYAYFLYGNSKSMRDNICLISSSLSSKQFTGCTGIPYFSVNLCANSCASGDSGYIQFNGIINGLFIAFGHNCVHCALSTRINAETIKHSFNVGDLLPTVLSARL